MKWAKRNSLILNKKMQEKVIRDIKQMVKGFDKSKKSSNVKRDANEELWLQYVKMGFLKHKFFEERLLREMRASINKKVGKIKKNMGPSITE